MNTIPKIYQLALLASIEASEIIVKIYNNEKVDTTIKSDGSPVTEADLSASKIINEILFKTNIPILSEENIHQDYLERKTWTENWCVDPLDGTKEFIKKNDQFAVSIAHIKNNKPVFGIIASPTEKTILFGGENFGVYISSFQSIKNKQEWVKMEEKKSFNSPLVVTLSHSPVSNTFEDFIQKIKTISPELNFIRKGSALKFFDLAKGEADIYPRFAPTMEWDIAAGQAIIETLGGKVISTITGEALTYNKEDLLNPHFVALTKPLIKLFS